MVLIMKLVKYAGVRRSAALPIAGRGVCGAADFFAGANRVRAAQAGRQTWVICSGFRFGVEAELCVELLPVPSRAFKGRTASATMRSDEKERFTDCSGAYGFDTLVRW